MPKRRVWLNPSESIEKTRLEKLREHGGWWSVLDLQALFGIKRSSVWHWISKHRGYFERKKAGKLTFFRQDEWVTMTGGGSEDVSAA